MTQSFDGASATFNCARESTPGDGVKDCVTPEDEWSIFGTHGDPPYELTPSASVDLTALTGTTIEVDMTDQVLQLLSHGIDPSWLMFVTNSTFLGIHSSESADSNQHPALVLSLAEDDFVPSDCPAPAIDSTRISRMVDVAEHIRDGSCPGQFAAVEALDPTRIAHLRGFVSGPDGLPLPGVTVTILSHPELGWARSRTNGYWDMAINGGGKFVIELTKSGYLPVQRTVEAFWNDSVVADDVVLVPQQPSIECEPISAVTGGFYVGPEETGTRGPRQVAVYIPDDDTTQVHSGSTVLSEFCVCSTEYTVDRNAGSDVLRGELAMPGELPPTVAYTYAVDLELREREPFGACTTTRIPNPSFSKPTGTCTVDTDCSDGRSCADGRCSSPVFAYLTNFLGFEPNTAVPNGYYDAEKASWVPEPDGRVVRVLDVGAGNCAFDVDDDGIPDIDLGSDLNEGGVPDPVVHHVTDPELAAFSTRCGTGPEDAFAPGDVIWRVPLTHFSPYDWNWAADFIDGALLPFLDWADAGPTNNICEAPGSIIGCEDQTLGETIPVAGTPWALHYQSERQRGRRARYAIELRFGGVPMDPDVPVVTPDAVHIRASVAGRRIVDERVDYADGSYLVTWDGLDAWGRLLQGAQAMHLSLGYVYPATYADPEPSQGRRFGAPAGTRVTVDAREVVFWANQRVNIGGWDESAGPSGEPRGRGLGGWSLSPHHVYDAEAGILYRGDGTTLSSRGLLAEIDTQFDGSTSASAGCFSATGTARACAPHAIVVAPDGTIYFTSEASHQVYRVTGDGVGAEVYAGTAAPGSGDGDRFTAQFSGPTQLAITRSGSLLVLEPAAGRLRRIDGEHVTTLAAGLTGASGLAVGSDDWTYVTTGSNAGVLAVAPNGHVQSRVANLGMKTEAIVTAANGDLIVESRVLAGTTLVRVQASGPPDDRITILAAGCPPSSGDPTCLHDIGDIALGDDGSIYFSEPSVERVRRLTLGGAIETVAGRSVVVAAGATRGDGGPAVSAGFTDPTGLGFDGRGTLYISDIGDQRIRVIRPALPNALIGELAVPEPDGSLVYRFDERGRHISTIDGTTGATLLEFRYAVATGLLSAIERKDAKYGLMVKRISDQEIQLQPDLEVDATVLTLHSHGHLASVTSGAAVHSMDYYNGPTETGLLGGLVSNASTGTWAFGYDSMGRLVEDRSSDLHQTLTRSECGATLSCAPGAVGWRVAHSYHDSWGDPTSWQSRTHDVIYTGDVLRRTVRDELGVVATLEQGGGLEYEPISPHLGSALPVSARSQRSDGTVVDVAYAADPRPGLDPYPRAIRILRGAAIDAPATNSPDRTTISLHRTTVPPAPATLLDVDELTDTLTIQGMSDGVSPPSRQYQSTYARTHTLCADHYRRWTSPSGLVTEACLDGFGRVVEVYAPGLEPMTFTYDAATGHMASAQQGSRVTTTEYKNPSTGDEQWWAGTLRAYDGTTEVDRLTLVRDSGGFVTSATHNHLLGGAPPTTIGFTRDPLGRLEDLTTPRGTVHAHTWTDHDALSSYQPPSLGGSSLGTITAPDFDPAHRPEKVYVFQSGGSPEEISYDYDGEHGFLETVLLSSGRELFIRRFTASTPDTVNDGRSGFVRSMELDGSVVSYQYDGPRLFTETWEGSAEGTVLYDWDSFEQLDALNVAGVPIDYDYDDDGRLTTAGDLVTSTALVDAALPTEHWERSTTLDQVDTLEVLDRMGELSRISASSTTAPDLYLYEVLDRDYVGRELERTEGIGASTSTFEYQYDGDGRLEQVEQDGSVVAHYTYDANGNRESASYFGAWVRSDRPNVSAASTTYDAQDRMTSYGGCTYTYLGMGALETRTCPGDGTTTYEYDLLGNLLSVNLPDPRKVEYEVDGLGRRIARRVIDGLVVVDERRYLYMGGLNPVAELDESNQLQKVFVYGTRSNVPDYILDVPTGSTYRVIADARGSVRLVVDGSGNIVQQIEYDAFGYVLSDSAPGFQPFGFAGGIYDPLTGLVRFGARDYDGITGRWTTKDPRLLDGGQANLYSYTDAEPINRVDPTGEVWWPLAEVGWVLGIGIVSGAANAYAQSQMYPGSSGLQLGAAFAAGFATGAVGMGLGFGGGLGTQVFMNMLVGASTNVAQQAVNNSFAQCGTPSTSGLLSAAGYGAASGLVGTLLGAGVSKVAEKVARSRWQHAVVTQNSAAGRAANTHLERASGYGNAAMVPVSTAISAAPFLPSYP